MKNRSKMPNEFVCYGCGIDLIFVVTLGEMLCPVCHRWALERQAEYFEKRKLSYAAEATREAMK